MHYGGALADSETWVAIAFILFLVLLGRKLWSALVGLLDKRAAAVRAELAEAARLRQEAEGLLADARAQRESALKAAARLLEGAQAEAARVAAAAAEDARVGALRRERMALDRIAAAEKAAVTEVRLAATEIAVAAAERLLRHRTPAEADLSLVDTAIASLPRALTRRVG